MSTKQISDQKENIYNHTQRITGCTEKQTKCLSGKNLEIFVKYNDNMYKLLESKQFSTGFWEHEYD